MNYILSVISEVGVVMPVTALAGCAVWELISIRERLARIEQQLKDIAVNCPGCQKES